MNLTKRRNKMDKDTNMNDHSSHEFEEGFKAWCDMKSFSSNPYEQFSFEWVEWGQGWKEAAGEFE